MRKKCSEWDWSQVKEKKKTFKTVSESEGIKLWFMGGGGEERSGINNIPTVFDMLENDWKLLGNKRKLLYKLPKNQNYIFVICFWLTKLF